MWRSPFHPSCTGAWQPCGGFFKNCKQKTIPPSCAGAMQQLRDNVAAAARGLVAEALERCLGPTGPQHLQQPGGDGAAARLLLQVGIGLPIFL